MRKFGLFCILGLASISAQAEVYRCVDASGHTHYQSKPCEDKVKSEALNIRFDPEKEAAAKAKLQAIQSEYDQRKQDLEKKQKESVEKQEKQQNVQLKLLEISAQQQQAAAVERQTRVLEKQNQVMNQPYYFVPPTSRQYVAPQYSSSYDQHPNPARNSGIANGPHPGNNQPSVAQTDKSKNIFGH